MTKEPKGTFLPEGKEPVIERIFQLVERYPSRSAAARAWGINVNTLKNYYRRQDIQPVPRRNQLQKIATQEGVSLEWLLTGEPKSTDLQKKEPRQDIQIQASSKRNPLKVKGAEEKLLDMLRLLSDEKLEQITRQLMLKGVETILYLLDEDNLLLLQQPDNVKSYMLAMIATGKAAPTLAASQEETSEPWVDDEMRSQLKDTLINMGFDRKRISTISMLFSLPEVQAREILSEYTQSERADAPQGGDLTNQGKKAKGV